MGKPVREGVGDRARAVASTYAPRGNECAFNNLKVLSRVLSSVYDEELRPVGLRASQLALMWAILAAEPVELGHLGVATFTDQTTLSRTIATLKRAGLVSLRTGTDRRVRMVALTAAGRERFAAAMPLWEAAQRRAGEWIPLDTLRSLARKVRKGAHVAA